MKRKYSTFDYPLVLSRKNRYLVVASPDFGYQIASIRLDLDHASAESIGRAVISSWNRICQRLHEIDRSGAPHPKPSQLSHLSRQLITPREASRILGISAQRVRRLVKLGRLPGERTLTGRIRLPLNEIAEIAELAKSSSQPVSPTPPQLKEAV